MDEINRQKDPFIDSTFTTILVISDMALSKEFYVDKLGAKIHRAYGGDSLVIKLLDHWLLLVTGGEPTPDKPYTHFRPPVDTSSVAHSFTIRVQNCRDSYQLLRERGVNFITPPVTRGQEVRCFFPDPDGHLFEISEYRG